MGRPGCCDRRSWSDLGCLNRHCCPKHGPRARLDAGLAAGPALIGLAVGLLGPAAGLLGLAAGLLGLAAGLLGLALSLNTGWGTVGGGRV